MYPNTKSALAVCGKNLGFGRLVLSLRRARFRRDARKPPPLIRKRPAHACLRRFAIKT